ncbi:hyaluronidase-like isoform X1 [Hemitrygon akajei]|uniref:hyaluronidase-like isoform X1 n=1 Tax=Hemitrygon akajei TaxID=2704970 RepID=UPI003BF9CCE6
MDWHWCGPSWQYCVHQTPLPTAYPLCTTLCLVMFAHVTHSNPTKQAIPPIMKDQPFLVFWNIPTEKCSTHRGVDLHLGDYGIVTNKNEVFMGENITIFYIGQLGKYPYYMGDEPVNGGCPQNASLKEHSRAMRVDVQRYLSRNYRGLAVIDWEEWRPFYWRNWGSKIIYRNKSQDIVRARHPESSFKQIEKQAQVEFDKAARLFLSSTLKLGQQLRPAALWGYYLFPDCYNYHYGHEYAEYDGRCPAVEIKRNNDLGWLWAQSNALFPSVYVEEQLKSCKRVKLYARYRVTEAMRVALMSGSKYARPVFVYTRSHYVETLKPLTQIDLIHTIGEIAALGASGVVLWGSIDFSRTTENCQSVKDNLKNILGPYILNVTMAARLCSHMLCRKHGRCYRKWPEDDAFLHLSHKSFHMVTRERIYVKGRLKFSDQRWIRAHFHCQCYKGWSGLRCSHFEDSSVAPRSEQSVFTMAFLPLLMLIQFLC